MSKKVISLALAVIMLFSVASTSFAALSGDAVMGFTVSASSTTVAPGQTVDITVSAESIPDEIWAGGQIALGYDKDAISLPASATASATPNTVWSEYMTLSSGYGGIMSASNTATRPIPFDEVPSSTMDQGKNWDSFFEVALCVDGAKEYEFNGCEEMFTLKFTVSENATPGSKIYVGLAVGTFESDEQDPTSSMYSNTYELDYWYGDSYDGECYDFSEATVELTVAAAEAPKVVFHRATQIQWADKDNGLVNLGFKGRFSAADFDLAFNENNQSAYVSEVGAKLTINGEEDTRATYFVHEYETGLYEFRAVLPGINLKSAEQANAEIKVEYYVMYKGTPYWSDPVITSASAIAAAAGYNA